MVINTIFSIPMCVITFYYILWGILFVCFGVVWLVGFCFGFGFFALFCSIIYHLLQ